MGDIELVIKIPEEQIKKSLEESKYISEDEGEKGFVNIALLYTNAQLEFVEVERKTDFYSCEYNILPEGHGRLIDADALTIKLKAWDINANGIPNYAWKCIREMSTIIEADKWE